MRILRLFILLQVCSGIAFSQNQQAGQNESADYYYQLADKLNKVNRYDSAMMHILKSIALYRAEFGEQNEQTAKAYMLYGNVLSRIGQVDSARKTLHKSLQIREQVLPAGSPQIGENLMELGQAYLLMGKPAETSQYYQKALSILEAAYNPEDLEMARPYLLNGAFHRTIGDFESSFTFFNKVAKIQESKLPQPSPALAKTYALIGHNYRLTDQLNTALEYHQKALSINQQVFELQSNPVIATDYGALAEVYRQLEQYNLALEYAEKSISVYRKIFGQLHPLMIDVLGTKANVLIGMDLFEEALKSYLEVEQLLNAVFGPNSQYIGLIHNNIGSALRGMQQYDSALHYYNSSLQINEKIHGANSYYVIEGNINIGDVYSRKGDHEEALNFYLLANSLAQPQASLRSLRARIKGEIAQEHFLTGNLSEAGKYIQQSFAENIPSFNDTGDFSQNPEIGLFLNQETLLYSLQLKGKILDEMFSNEGGIEKLETNHQLYLQAEAMQQFYQRSLYKKSDLNTINHKFYLLYEKAIENAMKLYRETGEASSLNDAFEFNEKRSASILRNDLLDLAAKKVTNIPDAILSKERKLKQDIARYQQVIETNYSNENDSKLQSELFDMNRQYEEFIADLENKFPSYHRLKYKDITANLSALQSSLESEQAMLTYSLGQDGSFLFVIESDEVNVLKIPDQEQIGVTIDNYYNALQNESLVEEFGPTSNQLYQYLIAPAKSMIADKKHLIITHPSLLSVPFESLLEKLPKQKEIGDDDFGALSYLGNRYSLSYHYSASLWYLNHQKKQMKTDQLNLLALAPFSEGAGKVLSSRSDNSPLPESKEEVNQLYEMFVQNGHEASVSFSTSATKDFLFQGAKNASVLHIATHSEADFSTLNLARIRLAECLEKPADDADCCLYPSSIYTMELNAALVVLSSCDSGAGKEWQSEGIMSLGRAFLNAGARQVVSSLWEADDTFSRMFMIKFYEGFLNDQNSIEAFSAAKRAMIRNPDWSHPKYWSNFILIGQ